MNVLMLRYHSALFVIPSKARNPVLRSNEERKAKHYSLIITRYSLGWILSLRFAPFRMTMR